MKLIDVSTSRQNGSVRLVGAIEQRSFAGWAMAFYRFDSAPAPQGWQDLLEERVIGPQVARSRSTALELMSTLRELLLARPPEAMPAGDRAFTRPADRAPLS